MITAELKYDNKSLICHLNKSTVVDDLYTFFTLDETSGDSKPPLHKESYGQYKRLKLDIHPKKDIVLKSLEIKIKMALDKNHDRVFCNGFQSASESREYGFNEKPDSIHPFFTSYFGRAGDDHVDFIPRKKGVLHSWTYAYHLQKQTNKTHFIGSLNESTGFTIFLYDAENQEIIIKKELKNLQLTHSFPALDVVMLTVDTPTLFQAFDTYFSIQHKETFTLPHNRTPAPPLSSVGISEHHLGHILNEKTLAEKLNFHKENDWALDMFHIENGWSNHVGDWLSPKPHVSMDMKKTVQLIHNQGIKASLSLSPFVIEEKSFIFKEKKDWILSTGLPSERGVKGEPLMVGFSPDGTKKLYALDFYHKDVQEYLTGIFHTVLTKWGFDAVKLDYLYAVCVLPRPHKTRGQIMHDAMRFLRQMVGYKILMAADVPLGSAFGVVDYCQISPDADRKTGHWLSYFFNYREQADSYSALKTALSRWQLSGRAFNTVLDCKEVKFTNLKEKHFATLSIVPILLKNTLFLPHFTDLSRNSREGGIEKLAVLKKYENSVLKNVYPCTDDVYAIEFSLEDKDLTAYCNLSGKRHISKAIGIEPYQTFITEY